MQLLVLGKKSNQPNNALPKYLANAFLGGQTISILRLFQYCDFFYIWLYHKNCSNEIFWIKKPISEICLESFENCSNENPINEICSNEFASCKDPLQYRTPVFDFANIGAVSGDARRWFFITFPSVFRLRQRPSSRVVYQPE